MVDSDWFLCPVRILDHEGPLQAAFPVENRWVGAQAWWGIGPWLRGRGGLDHEGPLQAAFPVENRRAGIPSAQALGWGSPRAPLSHARAARAGARRLRPQSGCAPLPVQPSPPPP